MSGVVDKNGQQWERCDECGEWTPIEELCCDYRLPGDQTGIVWVDICPKCAADD